MNAPSRLFTLLGAGSLLAISVASNSPVIAGPGPQFWNPTKPITTAKEAAAVKPDATMAMVCSACKTVLVRDMRHVGPLGKGHDEWFVVGTRHECDRCGGAITVVKGKTTDAMQHNCSVCGESAAFCCATQPADAKTPSGKTPKTTK